jgi:hypothetical protein
MSSALTKLACGEFQYAIAQGRAIFSFNFVALARWAFENHVEHFGIVVSNQVDFKDLLHRTRALVENVSAEELRNAFIWLP